MHRIAFSLIGGAHQFLHGVAVLAELSRRDEVEARAYVVSRDDAASLRDMLDRLGAGPVEIIAMTLPRPLETLARKMGFAAAMKVPRLIHWAAQIRRSDAIVSLERTSTLLKRMPGHCPPLVHIPHGAGDRAKGYEPRFRFFDLVLVAGEKDRTRLLDTGLLKPDRVAKIGYSKLAALRALGFKSAYNGFSQNRPTVLYIPHFDRSLSSWDGMGRAIIDRLARDGRFNLIVAPHMRLFEHAAQEGRALCEEFAGSDNVHIDPGSQASLDMTYTMQADLLVSDISSQIYEFCIRPRPCIFVNVHGVRWEDDPSYAMWRLGDVIEDIEQLVPAIENAFAHPEAYANRQREAVHWSLGDLEQSSDVIASDRILELLAR